MKYTGGQFSELPTSDAYGCLGVLQLNAGMYHIIIYNTMTQMGDSLPLTRWQMR
jgi:hypothetical protein